jgi:signal transduction histidine kinase
LGLAILAGLVLAGRLLRPIARVTETARQIGSSGDLSRRITLSSRLHHDEVGRLTLTFNSMLEKLETSFKAQRQFVADASHELKTPLTAILGHANLLRRRGKTNPELLEETTSAIIEEGERLHRLTLDLLELARLDERPSRIVEDVNLAELAEVVVAELRPLAEAKAVHLDLLKSTPENGGSEPILVGGDRDKLKQVILNLLENALKFTPPGGKVTAKAAQEEYQGQAKAIIEMRDSGCGIEAEYLPHIFERFYRADSSRNRPAGGSGLGLAIVQEIARQHGGEVEVESQPGQGSTFRVWLPLTLNTADNKKSYYIN